MARPAGAQHWQAKTREERFWARVQKSDGCWLWTGSKGPTAYGTLEVNYKQMAAHRFSYELHYGPIPAGLFACHRCDTPLCVRPDHLFLGTPADNSRDMVQKGRTTPNQRARGKVDPATVAEIRRRVEAGELQISIADEFGLDRSTVYNIVHRRTWKNVA